MTDTRGYKVAAVTLILETILAFGLVSESPTIGIFTIFAMVIVGVAWLPAALLIFAGARDEGGTTPAAYIIAGACGLVGGLCLLLLVKWTLVGLSVK